MKVVVVLSAVLAMTMAMGSPMGCMLSKKVHEARKTCMTQLGISMPKVEEGKHPGPPPPEMSEKLKCLDKCILEKLNIISAKGDFSDKDVPAELKEPAKKCFEQNKALEPCDRADKFIKCVFNIIDEGMRAMRNECAKETKTELKAPADVKDQHHHGAMLEESLKDEKMACFNRCMFIKMKKMNENGDFLLNNLCVYVPDGANVTHIAATCSTANNQTDKCAKAAQRGLCLFQELKKLHKAQ